MQLKTKLQLLKQQILSRTHTRTVLGGAVVLGGLILTLTFALSPQSQDSRSKASESNAIVCENNVLPLVASAAATGRVDVEALKREVAAKRDQLKAEKKKIIEDKEKLKKTLQERKAKLKELIKSDPKAAIAFIKSEDTQSLIKHPTSNCIEKEVTITGNVTRVTGHFHENSKVESIVVPLLQTPNENIPLLGIDETKQDKFEGNRKATIKGYRIDDEIIVDTENSDSINIENSDTNVLQAVSTSETPTWKAIVLIYRNTDVTFIVNGRTQRVVGTMSQSQVDNTIATVRKLPGWISSWSNGYGKMSIEIVQPPNAITKVKAMNGGVFWLDPILIKSDLDKYAPRGRYDSIFVIYKNDNNNGTIIPRNGGWGMEPSESANGAGYTVLDTPDYNVNWRPVETIMVHEWLHQVLGWLQQKGHRVPNIDNPYGTGYLNDADEQEYFKLLMTGRLNGYKVISPEIWKTKTPTGGLGSNPVITSAPSIAPTRVPTPTTAELYDLRGNIFEDKNGNRRKDAGEDGVGGARITFVKKSTSGRFDLRCCSVTSESNGNFTIPDRTQGEYQATITAPSNYRISGDSQQTFTLSSNVNLTFGLTKTANSVVTPTSSTPQRTPTPSVLPDLVVEKFELTDANGTVRTTFKRNERIFVKVTFNNIGQVQGRSSTGYTYSTFYRNEPNTITQFAKPSDPRNFYMANGQFGVNYRKEYGSYSSHKNNVFFKGEKYFTQSSTGTFTARVFFDYDKAILESNENNNQKTVTYRITN